MECDEPRWGGREKGAVLPEARLLRWLGRVLMLSKSESESEKKLILSESFWVVDKRRLMEEDKNVKFDGFGYWFEFEREEDGRLNRHG